MLQGIYLFLLLYQKTSVAFYQIIRRFYGIDVVYHITFSSNLKRSSSLSFSYYLKQVGFWFLSVHVTFLRVWKNSAGVFAEWLIALEIFYWACYVTILTKHVHRFFIADGVGGFVIALRIVSPINVGIVAIKFQMVFASLPTR